MNIYIYIQDFGMKIANITIIISKKSVTICENNKKFDTERYRL